MGIFTMTVLALGVSIDAFSVSVTQSVILRGRLWRNAILCALFFGGFQIIMPLVGGLAGYSFERLVGSLDHWVAFALLCGVGGKMIFDSFKSEDLERHESAAGELKTIFVLAIATSIDALAVGASLSLGGHGYFEVILPVALLMGGITGGLSAVGVCLGQALGGLLKFRMELVAGLVLIALGVKMLLEHL